MDSSLVRMDATKTWDSEILNRLGQSGGSSLALDLDDSARKLVKCVLTNTHPTRWMVMELLNGDGSVKATYVANPGQGLTKNLSGAEQHAYTIATNGGASGTKTMLSNSHRVYYSDVQPIILNGLEWDGNEAAALERRIVWANPFPIYPATYVFRAFPRKKLTGPNPRYYTMFFWGNNGTFTWANGGLDANTYYGSHPYPVPAPDGPGQFEISVAANDFLTGTEVVWDRWYTQVFRAWREDASTTHHEFYWDWPDLGKIISHTVVDGVWAATNPPSPAIVVGQAPNNGSGNSWGGYVGFEEYKGIIRGMQFYDAQLSLAEITSEIASPGAARTPWYLNLNPTVTDISDKSGSNHNPAWEGADRPTLWTG